MDNGFSSVVATAPAAAATGSLAQRPKSAGVFPSGARRLLIPPSTASSPHSSSPFPDYCSRYQWRGGGTPQKDDACHQRRSMSMSTAMVPVARPRTASAKVTRRVVQEEIELQRRVSHDAQRQLKAVQAQLEAREKELTALQQQLDMLHVRSSRSNDTMSSALVNADASNSADCERSATQGDDCEMAARRLAKAKTAPQSIPLKDQLANQDSYKKKLRHMLDRLTRAVQVVAANETLLRQQTASARREQALLHEKLAQERNVRRSVEAQRARLVHQRAAYEQDMGQLFENYRDEISARTAVTTQRQVADRRRQNLLQLMESRPPPRNPASDPKESAAVGERHRHSEAVLRRSQTQTRRINSSLYSADMFGRHDSIFELYEAQYDRILEETGESDITRVLESYLGYSESTKRLAEMEQELSGESRRLELELQAHEVLLERLRASGLAEVEKRKKIRDYLEGVMHARQTEKSLAKERFGEAAKLFVYIQQGVFNVVDLLLCLGDRPQLTSPSTTAKSVIVGGTLVPMIVGAESISDAACKLTVLVQQSRVCLQAQALAARSIEFSADQVDKLMHFMPELELDRLVGGFAPRLALNSDQQHVRGDGQQPKDVLKVDEGDQETAVDIDTMRRTVKDNERETLREVDVLLHTIEARKVRQAILDPRCDRRDQPKDLPIQRWLSQQLPAENAEDYSREKLDVVHAFFREKHYHERQQLERRSGAKPSGTGAVRSAQFQELLASIETLAGAAVDTKRAKPPPNAKEQPVAVTVNRRASVNRRSSAAPVIETPLAPTTEQQVVAPASPTPTMEPTAPSVRSRPASKATSTAIVKHRAPGKAKRTKPFR